MKYIQLLICLLPLGLFAQTDSVRTIKTNAALTNATVYYGYGAELQHTAKASLQTGMQELVISGIALQPDARTMQVACPDNVTLLSQRITVETIAPPKFEKDAAYKRMEDTLKLLNRQMQLIDNEITTNNAVISKIGKMLDGTVGLSGKDMGSDGLIKLADYYQVKLELINKKTLEKQQQKEDLQELMNQLTTRMNEKQNRQMQPAKQVGQLVLQVMTTSSTNADFTFTYFTPSAGWVASYDMRVKTADNSFKLGYRASVQQTTGLNWKQVKLTLSTSNPNLSNTMPLLQAWYLSPVAKQYIDRSLSGRVNAQYNTVQTFSETVVVAYDKAGEMKEDAVEKPGSVETYLNLAESQLNTNFAIDLPYDIPADGKQYAVAIKEENITASYKHYAVPKLDADAFLVAEIASWENLNLLPGEANIIMDNVYLGKSFIDPNSTADTLNISLGRDKRVAVKRVLVKEMNRSKVKGDFKTENFVYELTVKNNKKQPLNILLKDQHPLSNTKDIEVTLDDSGDASVNTDTGVLTWKINLAPGESKKVRFGYSLKYPKAMTLKYSK